jgi:hypothetical protein
LWIKIITKTPKETQALFYTLNALMNQGCKVETFSCLRTVGTCMKIARETCWYKVMG